MLSLVILLFQMPPQAQCCMAVYHSHEQEAGVMCLMEEMHVLEKLRAGMSQLLLPVSSVLVNQKYMLNKLSLNRSTHATKLCIDWLVKIVTTRDPFPQEPCLRICQFIVATLWNVTMANNEHCLYVIE